MDTNTSPHFPPLRARVNRRHPLDFKRAVVEQSFLPGASVARLARSHDINANLIFAWRKLYRDGALASEGANDMTLLPVTMTNDAIALPLIGAEPARQDEAVVSIMEMEVGKARLTIRGKPDTAILQAVLAHLLR